MWWIPEHISSGALTEHLQPSRTNRPHIHAQKTTTSLISSPVHSNTFLGDSNTDVAARACRAADRRVDTRALVTVVRLRNTPALASHQTPLMLSRAHTRSASASTWMAGLGPHPSPERGPQAPSVRGFLKSYYDALVAVAVPPFRYHASRTKQTRG